nr:hypothetical protein [Tanacetum cinerariifolium]
MAFGGNTCDLGSFGEETDEITDLHQIIEEVLLKERGDGVASIKRRRRDLFSDGVWNLETTSGSGQLKEDLELSTYRRRPTPCGLVRISPAPDPSRHDDPFVKGVYGSRTIFSTCIYMGGPSLSGLSTMKSVRTWPRMDVIGLRCSAMDLGAHVMSDGFQENMSRLLLSKSQSSIFPFSDRLPPIVIVYSRYSGWIATFIPSAVVGSMGRDSFGASATIMNSTRCCGVIAEHEALVCAVTLISVKLTELVLVLVFRGSSHRWRCFELHRFHCQNFLWSVYKRHESVLPFVRFVPVFKVYPFVAAWLVAFLVVFPCWRSFLSRLICYRYFSSEEGGYHAHHLIYELGDTVIQPFDQVRVSDAVHKSEDPYALRRPVDMHAFSLKRSVNASVESLSLCLIWWISMGSLMYFFCCEKFPRNWLLRRAAFVPSCLSLEKTLALCERRVSMDAVTGLGFLFFLGLLFLSHDSDSESQDLVVVFFTNFAKLVLFRYPGPPSVACLLHLPAVFRTTELAGV